MSFSNGIVAFFNVVQCMLYCVCCGLADVVVYSFGSRNSLYVKCPSLMVLLPFLMLYSVCYTVYVVDLLMLWFTVLVVEIHYMSNVLL